MRAGVYLAHPRPGSFNHAVFDAVVEELRGRGCEVLAHDLCAEGFPPVLAAEETGTVAPASAPVDPQVALHRAEVATLDALVFVHPNWWGMPPPFSRDGCSASWRRAWRTSWRLRRASRRGC